MAKAIYDNKLLDCYFTRSFYKHILGKSVKYTDMESEDYAFSQGLIFLVENHVSLLGTELNFSVEVYTSDFAIAVTICYTFQVFVHPFVLKYIPVFSDMSSYVLVIR